MPLHPMTEADYKAEGDLEALARAKEIERDPARLATAKRFAEDKKEEFARIAESLPSRPKRAFNGAVKKSKMVPAG